MSHRYLLASDLDGTLVGDPEALRAFNRQLSRHPEIAIAYVTGRHLDSARQLISEQGLIIPDAIISEVGASIHLGPEWMLDIEWRRRMIRGWSPPLVRMLTDRLETLRPQPPECQSAFKCSYYLDAFDAPSILEELQRLLVVRQLDVRMVYSSGKDLDLLPPGAGKANAVRYLARRLGLPLSAVLCCGDSGNDRDMLLLPGPSAVVANAHPELAQGLPASVYRARSAFAAGVQEALGYFGWL